MEGVSKSHSKQGIVSFVLAILSILSALALAFLEPICVFLPSLVATGSIILAILDLRRGDKKHFPILALVISGVYILLSMCALVTGSIYYVITNS